MNYKEAMEYIKNTAKFGSNLGLERTEKLLELLGDPHKKVKCIHIAGTNGKGSTTAMLSKVLKEAGYKVGMYTSPYIEEFEERIQINEKNIEKEKLSKLIEKVSKAVDSVVLLGYDHPTEFEIISCAMFLYFYEEKVDYAVVEVGLGGRLDSTNVIPAFNGEGGCILSIITSISYDHMNVLGDSLEKIAEEKCGIIKEGIPVVSYPTSLEIEKVIERFCRDKNCKWIRAEGKAISSNLKKNSLKQNFKTVINEEEFEVELSLLGKHQILNAIVVLFAVRELKLDVTIEKEVVLKALKEVKWKGRMEVLKNSPVVLIDGAHNIDGITKLTESIDEYFNYKNLILILGLLADKEVNEIVSKIAHKAEKIITVTPNSDRAENSLLLAKIVKDYNENCQWSLDYKEAYLKALEYADEDSIIVISGSLYMIGDMRRIIINMENK